MCNAVKQQPLSEEGGVEEVLSQLSLLYFWPSLLSRSTNPSSFKSWSEVAKWFIFGVFNQHRSVIEKRPFCMMMSFFSKGLVGTPCNVGWRPKDQFVVLLTSLSYNLTGTWPLSGMPKIHPKMDGWQKDHYRAKANIVQQKTSVAAAFSCPFHVPAHKVVSRP